MNDITWLDVFKMLIPITVVIIAGFLALLRMRENVRLDAKLKWKEEFRDKIVEFTNIAMNLEDKALWLDVNDEVNNVKEAHTYININQKLHTIYFAIEMMLDIGDIRTEALRANYRFIVDQAYEEASGTNKDEGGKENIIDEFYETAKEIYDDNKYINYLVC